MFQIVYRDRIEMRLAVRTEQTDQTTVGPDHSLNDAMEKCIFDAWKTSSDCPTSF